ncbi:MAG: hypothetical protein HQL31_06380 [Planctomycetes bacterium]|nr:hypothetical protein [Planctomycetota bacterium]
MRPLGEEDLLAVLRSLGVDAKEVAHLAEASFGRVDMALHLRTDSYKKLLEWIGSLLETGVFSSDYLQVAEEAVQLADKLEDGRDAVGEERGEGEEESGEPTDKRAGAVEVARIFLHHFIRCALRECRSHFVASHILNLAVAELLEGLRALATSGHIMLSLEHFFSVAQTRHAMIRRYSALKETAPLAADSLC